jgi:hypothetical protein
LFFLRVLIWFCIGLAVAVYARVLREYPDVGGLQVVAYLVVGAAIIAVAMAYMSRAVMRKHMLAPDGAFLSPQAIRFTEEALVVESRTARTEMPWDRFLSLDEDDANYYLFVDAMQLPCSHARSLRESPTSLRDIRLTSKREHSG